MFIQEVRQLSEMLKLEGVGHSMKEGSNPMTLTELRLSLMRQAPRCGARNRAGKPCEAPAVKAKKRCRMHGGTNPGAPEGPRNGNWRHGLRSRQHAEMKRQIRELLREARDLAETF